MEHEVCIPYMGKSISIWCCFQTYVWLLHVCFGSSVAMTETSKIDKLASIAFYPAPLVYVNLIYTLIVTPPGKFT